MNLEEICPRFDEILAASKARGDDRILPAIALTSLIISMGARPVHRDKTMSAFFSLLSELRPDITPEQLKQIEAYLRALTADGKDFILSRSNPQ